MAKATLPKTIFEQTAPVPSTITMTGLFQVNFVDWYGTTFSLSILVSGIGGIDTGSVGNSTFYYVYKVSGGIVASLSSIQPTGFSTYRKVGAFYTGSTGALFKKYSFGEANTPTHVSGIINSAGVLSAVTIPSWLTSGSNISGNAAINYAANIFSISPNLVVHTFGTRDRLIVGINETLLTSCSWGIQTTAGVATSDPCKFIISKSGIDAIQPIW